MISKDTDARIPTGVHIVVAGGGQSARWLLYLLAEQLARDGTAIDGLRVTVIESGSQFGTGLAWDRHNVLEVHLASRADMVTRWQYGDQQQLQFERTAELLREFGAAVLMIDSDEVIDLVEMPGGFHLTLRSGVILDAQFAILATGYGTKPWRGKATQLDQEVLSGLPGIHRCPWPAKELQSAVFPPAESVEQKRILLLGSYLTAVDTAVTLASQAGQFNRDDHGRLRFDASSDFHICMASRSGLLPAVWGREAAKPWRCRHFTEAALKNLREVTGNGQFVSMAAVLRLLGEELCAAAAEIDGSVPKVLSRLSNPERRLRALRKLMSKRSAAELLQVALHDVVADGEMPHSYLALRHCGWQAPIDSAIALWNDCSPWFSAEDADSFEAELKTTFYNYMLPMTLNSALELEAMMRSGHLSLIALGSHYELAPHYPTGSRFTLRREAGNSEAHELHFTDIVDATGHDGDLQQSHSTLFQSLLQRGVIQPAMRQFRYAPVAHRSRVNSHRVLEHAGCQFLRGTGVYANPRTCEVIPRGHFSTDYMRTSNKGLYAMGPNLSGQFSDAQSIGQVQRDARRIVADIQKKILA
ncbi:hypothetical protein ACQ4WP_24345 [Janthinobacterium sp. GB4P2]|uniref:hypothetical protein n=1 Tax=Janthinobacterium sp. GB4P2 TaxID=3424189 RepID=UPI003F1F9282